MQQQVGVQTVSYAMSMANHNSGRSLTRIKGAMTSKRIISDSLNEG